MNLHALFISLTSITGLIAHGQSYQIDTFIRNRIKEFNIPAVSVAVIDNGKVVLIKSYGKSNLECNARATKETSFQLASSTKLISATALMTLVQNGKLDLNEKVRHYLRSLPNHGTT
jgi:CubicO group peptidase (beta-lactamase class C family)